jgi:16S rRNA (uracil1498-N3)-methyltransferase
MHRFYLAQPLAAGEPVVVDQALARQLKSVLRLATGDRVRVFGGGREFEAEITALDARSVTLLPGAEVHPNTEPRLRLTLYMALIKGEKFDWGLQKATELGVHRVVPVRTMRTVKTQLNPARAARILTEATEQCGRLSVPTLGPVTAFAEAIDAVGRPAWIAYEGETASGPDAVAPHLAGAAEAALFIGPEGGFDPAEVAQAEAAGIRRVGLGPRILRAETAAVAGVTLFMHLAGEYQLPEA